MLSARRVLILRVAAGIFMLTVLLTFLLPKTWTASASIHIDYRDQDPLGGRGLSAVLDDSYMQTQLELLHSQRVAEGVVDLLRLRETPAYRKLAEELGADKADQELALRILRHSRIEHVRGSRVVWVRYEAGSPVEARDYADALVQSYIRLGEEMTSSRARSLFEQYNAQLEKLREHVDDIQRRLTAYQQKNQILNIREHGDLETQKLNELGKALSLAQSGLQTALATRQATQDLLDAGMRLDETPAAARSPILIDLKAQLSRVERELGDAQNKFGRNHPTVRGLAAERRELLARIQREAQAVQSSLAGDVERLRNEVQLLQTQVDEQRTRVLSLMGERDQIDILQRELAGAEQVYSAALKSYDMLSMASNVQAPNVAVLKVAEVPVQPSRPKVLMNLVFGLLAGLGAGGCLALSLELLYRRARAPEDLMGDPGLPLLGLVDQPAGGA